jgi:hypothetical protein
MPTKFSTQSLVRQYNISIPQIDLNDVRNK